MKPTVLALCALFVVAGNPHEVWARQTVPEAPTLFMATNVVGSRVSMSWVPPTTGPAPTGYRLAGGASSSVELGSVDLPPVPSLEANLPPGFWYLRVYTLVGGQVSGPSGTWTVRVGGSTPPTSPGDLIGVANGNSFGLTWRNRFQGGDPTSLILDVTGSATGSLPLPLTNNFRFDGVPPGTYTFRLRAVNRFGVGNPSAPVTLTFPSPCTGVPDPVVAFVAYAVGNTLNIKWRTAATGAAPTRYLLSVSGAFTGSFSVAGHALSGAVPPGSYTLSMVATNACGSSAAVPAQTVTVS